jgi:hypothetical protein
MPADHWDEYNRLVLRYEDANEHVYPFAILWQQWIAETELHVFWLHSLKAWEERRRSTRPVSPSKA